MPMRRKFLRKTKNRHGGFWFSNNNNNANNYPLLKILRNIAPLTAAVARDWRREIISREVVGVEVVVVGVITSSSLAVTVNVAPCEVVFPLGNGNGLKTSKISVVADTRLTAGITAFNLSAERKVVTNVFVEFNLTTDVGIKPEPVTIFTLVTPLTPALKILSQETELNVQPPGTVSIIE